MVSGSCYHGPSYLIGNRSATHWSPGSTLLWAVISPQVFASTWLRTFVIFLPNLGVPLRVGCRVDTVQVLEVGVLMPENAAVGLRIEDAGIARGHPTSEDDHLHHNQMIRAYNHHLTLEHVENGVRYVTDATTTTLAGATCLKDIDTLVQTG